MELNEEAAAPTAEPGAVREAPEVEASEASVDEQPVEAAEAADAEAESEEIERDGKTYRIDDFSKRIIQPAMNVLAAAIEADAISMRKDVASQVNNTASAITLAKVLEGRKKMVDNLVPAGDWQALTNTTDSVNLVDALKGLFNDGKEVGARYRDGKMGRTAGFDFSESTHVSTQDRGTGTSYQVTATPASGSSTIAIGGVSGAGTIKRGEVITIAGVNRVHPETKVDTGVLMQFVVTAEHAGGTGNLSVSPALISTAAKQNVAALAAVNANVTIAGAASTPYGQSLLYHPDAFAFATADLVMPSGVDWSSRQVFDGISMRIVRQYDINNDKFPLPSRCPLRLQDASPGACLPSRQSGLIQKCFGGQNAASLRRRPGRAKGAFAAERTSRPLKALARPADMNTCRSETSSALHS